MSIGSGIAVVGIWIAVAAIAFATHDPIAAIFVSMAASVGTIVIANVRP